MAGGEEATRRTVIYCIVPRDLAAKLHEPLRRFYADDPSIEVIVERRAGERRASMDRRASGGDPPQAEQRKIHSVTGRRFGQRRASLVATEPGMLPRKARPHAQRLVFAERLAPSDQTAEDHDTARLVARFQAGDSDAFAHIYTRYFDRVYSYLRVLLRNIDTAEDATQQVFTQLFEALPAYEYREKPFRAWMFIVVRNYALAELKRGDRTDVLDPAEIGKLQEVSEPGAVELDVDTIGWITDRELLLFVERLPLPQRQVLLMRYMLGMTHPEIAAVLHRSHTDVRALHSRGLAFLRERLTAVGRAPVSRERSRMRRTRKYAPVLRTRRYALMR